jgi:hypothetical protein
VDSSDAARASAFNARAWIDVGTNNMTATFAVNAVNNDNRFANGKQLLSAMSVSITEQGRM